MKNFKFYFAVLLAASLSLGFFSCSDSDDKGEETGPDLLETNHFDIWVTVGEDGGMGASSGLVRSVKELEDQEQSIDFKGLGVNVSFDYTQESIIKGKFYYQVPKSGDRFVKLQIGAKTANLIKEIPFKKNTYSDRRYSHTWIDDNTLVIMAADGAKKNILWTKIDADKMSIISEGSLEFPADAPKVSKYSTSGLASYRKSDGKILYSYLDNDDKVRFYMAFINAKDMKIEKIVMEDRAEMMAGTAYGELLQSKAFFDENGDYYLACNTKIPGSPGSTQQFGSMMRIKKGATDFDKSYLGYRTPSKEAGKIITAELLAPGRALLYIMDPKFTGAEGWGDKGANCYYAILDLKADKIEVLDLPFNKGNFSQRSVMLGNKAYIGVNPDVEAPVIYVYNTKTNKMTKGSSIKLGYNFNRVVALMD